MIRPLISDNCACFLGLSGIHLSSDPETFRALTDTLQAFQRHWTDQSAFMNKAIFSSVRYLRFLRTAFRSQVARHLDAGDRKWVFRGFNPESIRLLGLTAENSIGYMRDVDKKRVSTNTNRGFSSLFNNKIEFQLFFENIFPMPRLYSVILKGVAVAGSPNYAGMPPMEALDRDIPLVLKPIFGGMGRGICFVRKAGPDYLINEKPCDRDAMETFLSSLDQYMVCERIEQHPMLRAFNPGTTNTLRILTVKDPDTGEISIQVAVQRIGTSASFPTDTFGGGGLGAAIDLDTGTYGIAVRRSESWSREEFSRHPDSGEQITGRKVPHWDRIKDELLNGLSRYPYFEYVGWDILVSEEGFHVIEGNHNPSNHVMQVHTPLLANPTLRRFYESHSIVESAS